MSGRTMRWTLVVTSLLLAAGGVWVAAGGFPVRASPFTPERHYERRVAHFHRNPVQPGDTVVLGDSLTELGTWDGLFDGAVRNRGVAGDDTVGILARLDEVTSGRPARVLLMVGTNDLAAGVDEATIVANVEQIVRRIATDSPRTAVVVQSVLPRGRRDRVRVESLNRAMRSAIEGHATWLDLHRHFVDDDGSMADVYSNDEVHLVEEGYRLWRDIIEREVPTSSA